MDYNTNCIADFHHKYPLPDCNSPQIQVLTAYCASDEQNNVPKLLEHPRISVTYSSNSHQNMSSAPAFGLYAQHQQADCWEEQKSYSFQKSPYDGDLDCENTLSGRSEDKNTSEFAATCDKEDALLLLQSAQTEVFKPCPKRRTHRNSHKLQLNKELKQQKNKQVQKLLQMYKLEHIDQPMFLKKCGHKIAKIVYKVYRKKHSKADSIELALARIAKINSLHQFKQFIQENRHKPEPTCAGDQII